MTLVLFGEELLFIKIAIVSTKTPLKPFSPKSMIHSTDLFFKYSRLFANSGVLSKNFGKTVAT